MRNVCLVAVSALALFATPALAREPEGAADKADKPAPEAGKPEQPIIRKDLTAEDVVATPATDLNLTKNEIPPLLVSAEERPYALSGLTGCRQIAAAIGELDGVLGEDIDLPQEQNRRMQPGRVAQSVVGMFIPFRGLIREISGANAHDRELQAAVMAGVARRSFLKGVGQTKGCRYPARSATMEVFNARMAALNAEPPTPARTAEADAEKTRSLDGEQPTPARGCGGNASGQRYVSQPVVQRTD
jgi:hypothetical protein